MLLSRLPVAKLHGLGCHCLTHTRIMMWRLHLLFTVVPGTPTCSSAKPPAQPWPLACDILCLIHRVGGNRQRTY
ncbi:hypothetical protein B0T09DRAFT_331889 [Sordaria sp. MPI-SDFR-AT-0083]|nr:hypothetical protein B0T09DRAFT_331889 [Sordaria sp. MPI-SDFR-AT-0083]